MNNDLDIILLKGGHNIVDSSWDKAASKIDSCYKIYMPVEGSANLVIGDENHEVKAGNFYCISGWRLDRQHCEKSMDIYWVHFNPKSLHMLYFLANIEPIHSWPSSSNLFGTRVCEAIERLFKPKSSKDLNSYFLTEALRCEVYAMILHTMYALLSENKMLHDPERDSTLAKIYPAIEYINTNIYNKIKLSEIAQECDLAPNYFHRVFKNAFGLTPLQYIMIYRLSEARHLLATTAYTVYDVAHRVGYDNEFYFSRIFKEQLGVAPIEYRKNRKLI